MHTKTNCFQRNNTRNLAVPGYRILRCSISVPTSDL